MLLNKPSNWDLSPVLYTDTVAHKTHMHNHTKGGDKGNILLIDLHFTLLNLFFNFDVLESKFWKEIIYNKSGDRLKLGARERAQG